MAYNPYDRNQSGIVFFGTLAGEAVLESNSNYVIDSGNSQLKVPNIVLNNGGKIGSASQTGILTLGTDGIATFSSGVVITGDLTVQGDVVTLNTATLTVEDNIVVLNSNVTGTPSLNAGLEIERGTGVNVLLRWNESTDVWEFTNDGSTYYAIPTGVANQTWTVAGDSGSNQTITCGTDTLTIAGGSGISTVGSATDTLTVHLNVDNSGVEINSDTLRLKDGGVSTNKIANSGITAEKLGTDSVTSTKIQDGAVTTNKIANSGVTSDKLGTDSVITIKIQNGAVTTDKIANSGVTNAKLANSSITLAGDGGTSQTVSLGDTLTVAGGSGCQTVASATDTVTVHVNVDGTTLEHNSDAIRVKDGGISNAKLVNSSITLAGDSGTNQTVSLGDTLTITGGSGCQTIGTATDTMVVHVNVDNTGIEINTDALRLKDGGVTTDKIANSGVTSAKLGTDSVITVKIQDGAVTEAKISRTVDSTFTTNDTIASDINLVAGGAGGITVKLPAPATGKLVMVKKTDSAAGSVTISRNNTETIDGATSKVLYYQYESMSFVSDGTNWFVI